jgi:plastocyanin
MRVPIRPVLASLLVSGALATMAGARAQHLATAYTPRVTIVQNDAGFTPADADGLGEWTFAPAHLEVTQGEQIEFDNPATSTVPHTVTSITWSGMAPTRTLTSGEKFDSSPTRDTLIQPGQSWTLDTSTLDPGQYVYYCTLHPWMVGTFTVVAAGQ